MNTRFSITVLNMSGDVLDRQSDIIDIFSAGKSTLIIKYEIDRLVALTEKRSTKYYDDIIEKLRKLVLTQVTETR